MAPAVARPHPLLRVPYGLLALALACSWLVSAALPAQAQTLNWGVDSPGPNHIIHGSFTFAGFVEAVREPDAVRGRIRRPDGQVELRNLRLHGEPQGNVTRRSIWTTAVDTDSLTVNGTYALEVQVVNDVYPDGSPWQGHEIIVDRPPVAELESVRVTDRNARTVEVSWLRSDAEDFIRYVLQRAQGDGPFADVHTAVTPDATTHVDTVPEDGEYRYRVKTVRRGADGGEVEAVSDAGSVAVKGRPQRDENPTPGADNERSGRVAPPPPAPSTRRSGGGRSAGSSGRVRVPSQADQERSNATFEERLDYGEDLPEWDPEAAGRESALNEGGTLTVFDRETDTQSALVPVAGGLVLTLFGLHIVRFLREDPGPAAD